MKFSLNTQAAEQIVSDCLVIGILDDAPLSGSAKRLDDACGGLLTQLRENGDLSAAAKSTLMLHNVAGLTAKRLLICGFGSSNELTSAKYNDICQHAGAILRQSPARNAVTTLHEVPLTQADSQLQAEFSLLALHYSNYVYSKTKPHDAQSPPPLETVIFAGEHVDEAFLSRVHALAEGVQQARSLGDLPPNICNPAYLEAQALTLAGQLEHVDVEVLQEEQLSELGLNALLAVGAGSQQGTRLIVLNYRAAGDTQPYVLVGKGVTFDSGGLSLKTREGMEQMKFDMGGAATCFGVFKAIAAMRLPINLSIVVAAVENMPDGKAYRPGDVLTTYEGLTVEVLNTDAEGRLALCDALSWTKRHLKPQAIIDIATLTGACVIALGTHATGLMSHDDELAQELLAAGQLVGDRAWRLPLWPEYQEQLNTMYADMKNIGGTPAGTITAGCFLQRFVKDQQRWAHLDIAGTFWPGSAKKSATGRPVRLLCRWLEQQAASKH